MGHSHLSRAISSPELGGASGAEPLFRCYIELKSEGNLKKLRKACQHLLTN